MTSAKTSGQRRDQACPPWVCSLGLLMLAVFVFASPVRAQSLTTIASFDGTNSAYPEAPLTLGPDGNFYGVAGSGESPDGGTDSGAVFRVTPNGVLTTLAWLSFTNGANPVGALTLGPDGNFYGTAYLGGNTNLANGYGGGGVFRFGTNGTLTPLVIFGGTNGANPFNSLTLGPDGNLYGTTGAGGADNYGTVFRMTTNGTLTTLVSFDNTNGANAWSSLVPGPDGNFYGVTCGGGQYLNLENAYGGMGAGTVFRVSTNGSFASLASFNSTNGECPIGLTLGNNGNFYGTTAYPGTGTFFRVTTNGLLTMLASLTNSLVRGSYFYDGINPNTLALRANGTFYGTATTGGVDGDGTVFMATTNGFLTLFTSFDSANGSGPVAGVTVGQDGNFYGTTEYGGANGCGAIFRINPPLGVAVYSNYPALYCPTSFANLYTLQMSAGASTNWANVTNGISLAGLIASQSVAGTNALFRLELSLAFPTAPNLGVGIYEGNAALFFPNSGNLNYEIEYSRLLPAAWSVYNPGIPNVPIRIGGLMVTNAPANAVFRLY